MALTPEDVVNKRFQPTKFREGYDQDEVDDFLDEVVVELRRLNQENEELRQRQIASESRIAELQRSGGQAVSAPEPVEQAAPEPEPTPEPEPEPVAEAPTPAPAVVASTTPAYAAPQTDLDPNNTNNLLQLARRLHDEHVKEGVEKKESLIAEGEANAARILSEADAKQRAQLAQLDQERSAIEAKIEGLRTFEREYRQKLKGYIESQLRELDTSGEPGSASTGSFGTSDTPEASFQGIGGN